MYLGTIQRELSCPNSLCFMSHTPVCLTNIIIILFIFGLFIELLFMLNPGTRILWRHFVRSDFKCWRNLYTKGHLSSPSSAMKIKHS